MKYLVTLSLLMVLCVCAEVRKATYPPDFKYISSKSLHASMQHMARTVEELNQILRTEDNGPVDAQRVAKLLETLEKTVMELDAPGRLTNHPMINANLDAFVADVRRARFAAEATPPNYFLAGAVAGSCMHCHGSVP